MQRKGMWNTPYSKTDVEHLAEIDMGDNYRLRLNSTRRSDATYATILPLLSGPSLSPQVVLSWRTQSTLV